MRQRHREYFAYGSFVNISDVPHESVPVSEVKVTLKVMGLEDSVLFLLLNLEDVSNIVNIS